MTPALSRKNALFLFLGIFVLLFGLAQSASAVTCVSGGENVPPSCTRDITYIDNGGAGLKECYWKVEVFSGSNWVSSSDWKSAGTCSGASWSTLDPGVTIEIGPLKDCSIAGSEKCRLMYRAIDNSNNETIPSTSLDTYNIVFTPAVSTNTASNVTGTTAVLNGNLSDMGGVGSVNVWFEWGLATSYGSTTSQQAKSATGVFNATILSLTQNTTYHFRTVAQNTAGTSVGGDQQFTTLDIIAPTVTFFAVTPVPPAWVNSITTNNPPTDKAIISWTAPDNTGGSGINHYELWRAQDNGGNPGTWGKVTGKENLSPATTSTTDTPSNGVWWYGLHAVDNAGNCITEKGERCPGDTGSDNVARTPKGPLKVQVDKSGPTSSVTNPPESSTQGRPGFDATFQYSDPGGSNLTTCAYKVVSNNVETVAWTSAGPCSGAGPVDLVKQITVGSNPPRDCRDGGTDTCTVFVKATDVAGNLGSEGSRPFTISIISTNQPPASPTSLSQFKNNETTAIANQGFTNESNVKLRASATDPGANEVVRLFFEVQLHANAFTSSVSPTTGTSCVSGTPWNNCSSKIWYVGSSSGDFSATPFTGTVNVGGLSHGTGYKWQVKTCDNNNACSGWVVFNATTPTTPNFSVDTAAPSIPGTPTTATPTSNTRPQWTWAASTDTGGSGLAGYTAQWCSDSNFPAGCNSNTATTASNSFTHSTALSQGTWFLRVKARDGATNESPFSPNGFVVIGTTAPAETPTSDTTAPPKPTCDPAGGTFQNSANNVTCSNTEAGVIIRYTLDGSSPTISSTLYTGPFDITSSATLKVAAWDGVDNRSTSPDNSYDFTILHNQAPNISSVSDTPDPIKANAQITFTVNWNDPNASDLTKIHICKTDAISGQPPVCSVGSWCDSASFSSSSPTSCSGTSPASSGSQNYYAFTCDDENACSSSKSGTFLVDATAPTISSFTRIPVPPAWVSTGSPSATVTWTGVSDLGGANLKQIEVWRAWDANGNGVLDTTPISEWDNPGNGRTNPMCTKTGGPPKCTIDQNFDTSNTDSDSFVDTNLAASGVYWYGLHVLDKAGNMTTESTPLKVQVDKDSPTAIIDAPGSASWLRQTSGSNRYYLRTTDEDLESGVNTNGCTFEVCSYEPNGTEHCKGTVARQCNIKTNITEITVGPGNQCDYQGWQACDIFVSAVDVAGNAGGSFKSYKADWTFPTVGKLYITESEGSQTYPVVVQESAPVTYRVHATDNVEILYCDLYIDNVREGLMGRSVGCTSTDCVFELNASVPAPGGSNTYHNNYAVCYDASSLGKQGTSEDIVVETLSVDLSAVPSAGSVNTLFDLTATVSGTMTGPINYKFDCTNNGTWELEVNSSTQNPFTAVDLCQYASLGTYTAKVLVQRGVGTKDNTVSIPVSSNSIPSATNLQNNNATADYCFVSSPPVILSWTFSDPGDSQSAYQVQVATNPGFSSIVRDSCDPAPGTCAPGNTSQSYAPLNLSYNTTYYWRVKVWDSFGDSSPWATASSSFTTPAHPYPVPNFAWTPALPGAQELVQFTDQTNFAAGATGKTWSWNFGDLVSGPNNTSTLQNPSHTYAQTGAFGVTLQSGDDVGSCSTQKTLNISIPFPEWQEISPF